MSIKPIILVTGATGAEGISVVKHLLHQNQFSVRALTRNADSKAAKYLATLGAKIIVGDLNHTKSLLSAMEGCYGVYGFSNFRGDAAKEFEQGMKLLQAVSKTNIQHFIFSSQPPAGLITKGRLPVPHFDVKAELEAEARNLNLNSTFVHIAFYYENLMYFTTPKKSVDGNYYFGFPQGQTKLATVSVEDVGAVIAKLYENPFRFIGRIVGIVGEDSSADEYAKVIGKVLNKKVMFRHVSREIFIGSGFPGNEELANMFEFNRLHISNREADLKESQKLYPAIQNFETWVKNNIEKVETVFVDEPADVFV